MVSYKMYDNMSLLIPHPYGEKQDIVMYIPENMDHTQNLMAMVYYSPPFRLLGAGCRVRRIERLLQIWRYRTEV